MLPGLRRGGNPAADGFKDFRRAQLGNKQTEGKAGLTWSSSHVGARAGNALDEAGGGEVAHGSSNGDAGCFKLMDEGGFTGELLAGGITAGKDVFRQRLEDLLMLWGMGFGGELAAGHDILILQLSAFNWQLSRV